MSRRVTIDQITFDEAVDHIIKSTLALDKKIGLSEEEISLGVKWILEVSSSLRFELFDTTISLTANTKQGGQNYE